MTGPSAIFFLDSNGKVLISRNFRGDIPDDCTERFAKLLEEDDEKLKPILEHDGITYIYIKVNNIYFLATTKRNSNAVMILTFLYRIVEVFKEYFKEIEEESIIDNFVIIYELLDEMMDFGFPQTTDTKLLQEFITQESYKLTSEVLPPPMLTFANIFRPNDNIHYKKNEVFLDVIENVNFIVNVNGEVIHSEILGTIKLDVKLSGIPELKLGLNDRLKLSDESRISSNNNMKGTIEMEDVCFHQCVRLSRFQQDRSICFIPPDGKFDLMKYRISTPLKALIRVETTVNKHEHSRIEYTVKARSQFKEQSTANNVLILIPVPADVDTPKYRANIGKVEYLPDKNSLLWKIKQFQGNREFLLRAHFGLPSLHDYDENEEEKAPITLHFDIPYYTASGIHVRYLKISEKSNYQALPWVRYITKSGDCQFRI